MRTVTVNISFQDSLLAEIDAAAKRESRSRSELLREAARFYLQRQQRWHELFQLGDALGKQACLTESLVADEIAEYRTAKKAARRK